MGEIYRRPNKDQCGAEAPRSDAMQANSRRAWEERLQAEGMPNGMPGRKRLGRRRAKKIAVAIGVCLLVAIVGLGAWLFYFNNQINANLQDFAAGDLEALRGILQAPASADSPYYVLVVGTDSRGSSDPERSDTIMLCRIDPVKKQTSILSIPRDVKIELPGYGAQKINAAMVYGGPDGSGGPAGVVMAVSNFVGVPISHYVQIDFSGFRKIIDALGGVTVTVPAYTYYDGISLQPGKQKLNGKQALVFARCRKTYATGDFQRAANQRQLMKVVAQEILGSPPTEMPGLITSISECVRTDLTASGILQIADRMRGMNTASDMSAGQVPCTASYISGVSYDLPDADKWPAVRRKFIDGVVPFVSDSEKQPGVDE
ncbi:MAG: LCP family protein [Actinomycetia bacterium]|nr:LCP family protein [Actinomycetes bacterium]